MTSVEVLKGIGEIIAQHSANADAQLDVQTVRCMVLEIYERVWSEAYRTGPCAHPRYPDNLIKERCWDCGRTREEIDRELSAKNSGS